MEWLAGLIIAGLFVATWLAASGRCPQCDERLDYNHIGYDRKYGYCHSCGYRGDK